MNNGMKVHSVHIRRFRSIERAELVGCGGLNVLIGRNNSGKSNLLATVDLVQRHLGRGSVAGPWSTARPQDEFTNRVSDKPVQIGVEYSFPEEINSRFRELLQKNVPHLEKAIEQFRGKDRLSILLAGMKGPDGAFLFVQSIAIGSVSHDSDNLSTDGVALLAVPPAVAIELFATHQVVAGLNSDLEALDRVLREPYLLQGLLEKESSRYYFGELRPQLVKDLYRVASGAKARDELAGRIAGMQAEIRAQIAATEHRETETPMSSFAGPTKAIPPYASWLIQQYGGIKLLHLKETREAVGREEADALLRLKVTRGGPERLTNVQQTIKTLLGVNVDAFQSEEPRRDRSAEIDVDRFLIEANGAGVREALRLVLDLELKEPRLVLIEEPEVHLHPGLEHAVYQYLRDKSQALQIFVTTHSTNFVDSVSFQNIYLVSKDGNSRTLARALDTGQGPLQIPSELGLRLSTVFMYDRLVFVEGASDEAILRELCKILGFDIASANVGFVQMGGVRNFAHFAARSTIDLLARRQVKMWFIADRDERNDEDVGRMLEQLGDRATLHVLQRRELENYLLDPTATERLIEQKRIAQKIGGDLPLDADVQQAIYDAARGMHDEVVRLRLSKALLGPIHLMGKDMEGTINERLDIAIAKLQQRKERISDVRAQITADLDDAWPSLATSCAPGTEVLDQTLRKFGVAFSKPGGDGPRLAGLLAKDSIPEELRSLLREITRTS